MCMLMCACIHKTQRQRQRQRQRYRQRQRLRHIGRLRLVGSIKLQVSFAKEPYKRDYFLQKRDVYFSRSY